MAIVALVADTQVGGTTALMPGSWQRDDGEHIMPNLLQKKLLEQWVEYWEYIGTTKGDERLVIVHNGDAIEGNHHDTTQLVTPRVDEQRQMFSALWDMALDKVNFDRRRDKMFFIRGTASHSGPGSSDEEAIAQDFGAIPYLQGTEANNHRDGVFTHYHLRCYIDGVLFDIMHHGPNKGTRVWTDTNSLFYAVKSVYFTSLNNGQSVPDLWIRAHTHRYLSQPYEGKQKTIRGMILPSWQADTDFVNRISWGTDPVKSFGGVVVRVKDGQYQHQAKMMEWEPAPIRRA